MSQHNQTRMLPRRQLLRMAACVLPFHALRTGNRPKSMDTAAQHEIRSTPLLQQEVAELGGKVVSVLVVEYAPGAALRKHKHPGTAVVGYVLEGAVDSQLESQPPVTYQQGQAWWEPPGTVHLVSKNASSVRPAKVLIVMIHERGQPTTVPID